MILNEMNIFTGETVNPPRIIWEKDERYAIIAFLLMSIDERMNAESLKKLNAFMGIPGEEAKSGTDEASDKFTELRTARDMIIREGNSFLEKIEQDESRYDCVMDEVDCVLDGNERCGIGNGYAQLGRTVKHSNLSGGAYWLFDYLNLVVFDSDYSGNKKRLLKHLARKWDIDKSVLPMLETSAKSLEEIRGKRVEIKESDMPYREAAAKIAELDSLEKAVSKELNTLDIAKDRATSAYVTSMNAIADSIEALGGTGAYRCRIRDEDEPVDDDDEEESLSDKIGDCIEEGIHKVADIICAPFEWMTDKLIEWM
jgi:hypothetical protein